MVKFSIRELDTFFISYDEPNAESNWRHLLTLCNSAKRIHHVKGFDAAHKFCATASNTPRLVIIDGDNWDNTDIFNQTIDDTGLETACFSFKSKNLINGLEYGNGGVKVWDKHTLSHSNTHENASSTDFCWDIQYNQVDYMASTTVQNCTPYQAWRSGYREGVKLSYIDGEPPTDWATQQHNIWKGNYSKLSIWCSIGRNAEYGIWAMLGARSGLYDIINRNITNTAINDYDWFASKWAAIKNSNPESMAREYGATLQASHAFAVPEIDAAVSSWFQDTYIHPVRQGLMK